MRDALLWAIPALLLGGLLRACLLHYLPYAYWGSDSRSYFDFTAKLFGQHYVSLVEKRRFLYPIFIAFVSLLPGAPLKWLPWIQHGLGLATLLPLAYVVRKNFACWRWWVVPITILYTAHPVILWYEHELLAENVFFSLIVWAFAGWTAWAKAATRERALRLWWLFFIPFATLILTRPAGRFLWPGILLGLLVVYAWRRLAWKQWLSVGALMVATLFVGSKDQGAWLLYTATFPLTQLNKPLHAEYKAEIRDMVTALHADLDHYYDNDGGPFNFLENPRRKPELTHFAALSRQPQLKRQVYMDLAKEGILAEPLNFLKLGVHRLVVSSNLSMFKVGHTPPPAGSPPGTPGGKGNRFTSEYTHRFDDDYADALQRLAANEPTPVPLALGYPAKGPLPPAAELLPKLTRAPGGWSERLVLGWVAAYQAHADLVHVPSKDLSEARPTLLGWLILAGFILSLALPAYRPTVGVWVLASTSYLFGVFLATQVNPRYFGASWPVLIPLLFIPLDATVSLLRRGKMSAAR